jgi:hypothetical protein
MSHPILSRRHRRCSDLEPWKKKRTGGGGTSFSGSWRRRAHERGIGESFVLLDRAIEERAEPVKEEVGEKEGEVSECLP